MSSRLRLSVLPELGGGLAEFSLRRGETWASLMRPSPAAPRGFNDLACYAMAPWCNRIAEARFDFRGERRRLVADWPDGTSIHGDIKSRRLRILDRSPCSARLEHDAPEGVERNWPWPYRAVLRYELDDAALRCELAVHNASTEPMPVGLGFHPFWNLALDGGDPELELRANVAGRYPCRGMIPAGPPVEDDLCAAIRRGTPLAGHRLDDVLTCGGHALEAELAWHRAGVRLRFHCSETFSHLVVYTGLEGPLSFACVEPVSMVNDGFNLMARGVPGTGVRVIEPGERFDGAWSIDVLDS